MVFLTSSAFAESNPSSTVTFATTAATKTHNTVTIDPSVLATSNGMSGNVRDQLASTSYETDGAITIGLGVVVMVLASAVSFVIGVWM